MSQFFESTKKWAVYEDGDFTFLEDGFVHQHPLDFQARYRTEKGKIQIEEKLTQKQKDAVSSHGSVKFQLPLTSSQDKKLYSRITSSGKCIFSYDNGLLQLTSGTKLNFFASYQTNRSFTNNVYKFGLACLGESYNYGFRFRYEALQGKNSLVVHLRGSNSGEWHHGTWKFNFFNIIDPSISQCIKSGLLLGLFLDGRGENKLYFRLQSGKRKPEGIHLCEILSKFKFNWTRMLNPTTKIGLETNFDFVNKDHPFSHTYLGALWTFPSSNTTLKAKINPLLTAALAISHNLGSLGRYSLGLQVKELGKQNSLRFGTRIELNL